MQCPSVERNEMLPEDGSEQPVERTDIPQWRYWVVQFDISHNAIALAFFAFTLLCQTVSLHFEIVPFFKIAGQFLFYVSFIILCTSVTITIVRALIFPPAIKLDFSHARLVNFFFLPVLIGCLFVLTTPPYLRSVNLFKAGFYILSVYQLTLSLWLFGEWLYGASLPTAIYPLYFMQTIGFFMLAIVAAFAHLVDQAIAMFSVGFLFWLLVFVTNFQHVSHSLDRRAERPQPTFFMFIAPPAQAAIASIVIETAINFAASKEPDTSKLLHVSSPVEWPRIGEGFLYVDIFLYLLMFRLFPTFWNCTFSFAWWAYVFPLSAAACAALWKYNDEENLFWGVLSGLLAVIACVAMGVVLSFTVWGLYNKKVPKNESCVTAYQYYYTGRKLAESADGNVSAESTSAEGNGSADGNV